MTRRAPTIELGDYHDEVLRHTQARPAGYHPATAKEPRRALVWNGEVLAGSNNGEGRNDWSYRPNVVVHTAVTGSGYVYGASVAGCNGSLELGYNAELSALVKVGSVDEQLLCQRPGCRAMRTKASVPDPAQSPPSKGDRVT